MKIQQIDHLNVSKSHTVRLKYHACSPPEEVFVVSRGRTIASLIPTTTITTTHTTRYICVDPGTFYYDPGNDTLYLDESIRRGTEIVVAYIRNSSCGIIHWASQAGDNPKFKAPARELEELCR